MSLIYHKVCNDGQLTATKKCKNMLMTQEGISRFYAIFGFKE